MGEKTIVGLYAFFIAFCKHKKIKIETHHSFSYKYDNLTFQSFMQFYLYSFILSFLKNMWFDSIVINAYISL